MVFTSSISRKLLRSQDVTVKQLLEAGVHFGHPTHRWNPKMASFIFTDRNGVYIIDLEKTLKIGRRYGKTTFRSRRPFRTSNPPLESQNGIVYFYRSQWCLHHRSRENS